MSNKVENDDKEGPMQRFTFSDLLRLLGEDDSLQKLQAIHKKLIKDLEKKASAAKVSAPPKKSTKAYSSSKPKLHHLKLISSITNKKN